MKARTLRNSAAVTAVFCAGLGAGWLLKPAPAPEGRTLSQFLKPEVSKTSARAAGSADSLAKIWGTDAAGKDAGELPGPFTSLQDIVASIGGFDLFDDVSGVELMSALPRILTTDLAAAKRMLEELAASTSIQGEARGLTAGVLMTRWMIQDPEGAMLYAHSQPGLFTGDSDILEGLNSIAWVLVAKRDPAKARALLQTLPENDRAEAEETLATCEALKNPLAHLTGKPLDEIRDADAVAESWARRDPRAAARWVAGLEDEDEAGEMITAVAKGWATRDATAAMEWARSLPAGELRDSAISEVVETITDGSSMELAAPLIATLPPEAADLATLDLAGHYESKPAPELVSQIINRRSGDSEFQRKAAQAAERVVSNLVESGNRDQAITWMAALPEGEAKGSASCEIARAWAEKDAVAASEWVTTLPEGTVRDRAAVGLIAQISSKDSERAFMWAVSISSEATMREQAGNVLRNWIPNDPRAAISAIEALPPNVREALWPTVESESIQIPPPVDP